MRKTLLFLSFLFPLSFLHGQGFVRQIERPRISSHDFWPQSLVYGADSSQVQVWFYRGYTGGATRAVGLYDLKSNVLLQSRGISTSPISAICRPIGKNMILVQDSPGGGDHSNASTWSLWDLNGGKEGSVFPNRYQASFISIKQDSIFVLKAKPLYRLNDSNATYDHQAHDTNTIYYLTHIDPANSRYEILDSIRLVPKVRLAGLQFLEKSKQWEVIIGERRIRFRRSSFGADTSFMDSTLALDNFKPFAFDTEGARATFFNGSISQFFYNESKKNIYEVKIGLRDSTYFDFSPLFEYFEKRGALSSAVEFNGATADLPVSEESTEIQDRFFWLNDTLHLFRLKSGAVLKHSIHLLNQYPELLFRDVLSDAKGGFYLLAFDNAGVRYKYFLLYVDSTGNTKTLVGDEPFALHYNNSLGRLKIFIEDPNVALNYRIVDASGRRMQEGDFQAYEGISLGVWQTGVYYLQLWTNQGSYLGQESFLISRL